MYRPCSAFARGKEGFFRRTERCRHGRGKRPDPVLLPAPHLGKASSPDLHNGGQRTEQPRSAHLPHGQADFETGACLIAAIQPDAATMATHQFGHDGKAKA